jgi:hypothetical protein
VDEILRDRNYSSVFLKTIPIALFVIAQVLSARSACIDVMQLNSERAEGQVQEMAVFEVNVAGKKIPLPNIVEPSKSKARGQARLSIGKKPYSDATAATNVRANGLPREVPDNT